MSIKRSRRWFTRFAQETARRSGHPASFLVALSVVLVWAITGPIFRFSDTWQLVINTGTTIITFLMVFLIQHTQNRDTYALQVKLDELIRVSQGAHTALLDLEELDENELEAIRARYEDLARKARARLRHGEPDTDVPDLDDREWAASVQEDAASSNPSNPAVRVPVPAIAPLSRGAPSKGRGRRPKR
jgi:low affinity Fe/Cu permease